MKLINSIQSFLKNKKGSVTIEFFFMILFLMIVFAFMVDLVLIRSTMGKLDNASYSLVNLLRERTNLYDKRDGINNMDLDEYKKLANLLLSGNKDSTSPNIYVVLEYKSNNASTILGDTGNCRPIETLDKLWTVSPYSEGTKTNSPRKVPLYQVTLCVEINSLFRRILLNEQTYLRDVSSETKHLIRSSSMSISR